MKIHLRQWTNPACMVVYTGKRYEMSDDIESVTCVRCLALSNHKSQPQFKPEQMVVLQPTPQSRKLYGRIVSAQWNDSFGEYAYTLNLTDGHIATAWQRELSTWQEGEDAEFWSKAILAKSQ